jgi:hypothetical protein
MKQSLFGGMNPPIPKPRSFSETKAAPKMQGNFGPNTTARGTTGNGGGRTNAPLSVPRSGCCGK